MNRRIVWPAVALVVGAGALPGLAATSAAAATGTPGVDAMAAEAALRGSGLPRTVPTARQDSDIVNDEIVVSRLDPRGLPVDSQLISRISSKPGEERTIKDPTSVTNIIYLNKRGRPTVDADGDGIEVTVGGPDGTTTLTQSLVDKPLPVAMHAEYRLNGEVVDPEVIVGASGDLQINYQVTNTDVKQQEITYTNAQGREITEKQPVFAPFVGTLSASLPESIRVTDTKGAIVTTDKSGNTVLLWNLLLYPPMGTYEQKVSFTAVTDSGSVPAVALNVVPVDEDDDPSLKFTTDLFEQTVEGNKQLASGLQQLNDSTMQLADGAAQLAGGIGQLADGTGAIAGGFSAQFVPGTEQLAAGVGQLAAGQRQLATALGGAATGADQLAAGSNQLADGLDQLAGGLNQLADQGTPELTAGAEKLRAGAELLSRAVGSPDDKPLPTPSPTIPVGPTPIPTPSNSPVFPTPTPTPTPTRVPTLVQAVTAAASGSAELADQTVTLNNNLVDVFDALKKVLVASGQVRTDAQAAATGTAAVYDDLCDPPTIPAPQCAALQQAQADAAAATAGAAGVSADLLGILKDQGRESVRAYLIAQGTHELSEALKLIERGVKALAVGLSNPSEKPLPGLVEGLDSLVTGVDQLDTAVQSLDSGAGQAASGAAQLSGGTEQLASGLGQAASGAGQLADGAGQLTTGAQTLAFGSQEVAAALNQLTAGADQAASGSNELAGGADALQKQGVEQIYRGVVKSSDQPALAAAFLKASAGRAATALPYGLPEGATGSVAYVMTMDAVTPSGTVPWQAAGLGLILLAGAGGAVAKNWLDSRGS